jgi:flagellar protein FlaF
MAVAEIIGAAVGVLLLVIVAYLLVGGTLSMAETVTTAQKDLTSLQEARLRTSLTIVNHTINGSQIDFHITNNGNEPVNDLPYMDVFSYNKTDPYTGYDRYTYEDAGYEEEGTWYIPGNGFENDDIHPGQLDPGVTVWVVMIPSSSEPWYYPKPDYIQVTTSNGVSAFSSI